jgi:hypothetical protein
MAHQRLLSNPLRHMSIRPALPVAQYIRACDQHVKVERSKTGVERLGRYQSPQYAW